MKKILRIGVVVSFMLALVPFPASANGAFTADLLAGQDINVGDVQVWNDATSLYVEYVIQEPGWCLTETHLHVADSPEGFPLTNKGNPIPGQFDYSDSHDPCELIAQYELPFAELGASAGDELVIAAHAVVSHSTSDSTCVVSDTATDWYDPVGASWSQAVATYVHPSWPSIADATWIWRTAQTDPADEYANVPDGGWEFRRAFEIPDTAYNISAALNITADNSYRVHLNGDYVDEDGSMDKDGPDSQSWSSVENYDVSSLVAPGLNTLTLNALNYFQTGSYQSNPAGLIFKVCSSYNYFDQEETAWGDGDRFVDKGNWATYIDYEVQGVCPPIASKSENIEVLNSPPANVRVGALESDANVRVWQEFVGSLPGDLNYDLASGEQATVDGPDGSRSIAQGTLVCSYYLHLDNVGDSNTVEHTAQLEFGANVSALIISGGNLGDFAGENLMFDADDIVGNGSTNYPDDTPVYPPNLDYLRGMEINYGVNNDDAEFNGALVDFTMTVINAHDSFRVILPALPAP